MRNPNVETRFPYFKLRTHFLECPGGEGSFHPSSPHLQNLFLMAIFEIFGIPGKRDTTHSFGLEGRRSDGGRFLLQNLRGFNYYAQN